MVKRSGPKIFISYAHRDASGFASDLFAWLEEEGYQPWMDRVRSKTGNWQARIEAAIADCKLVLAILTPGSVRTESYLRKETAYAQALERSILPIKIQPVLVPMHLAGLHLIDAASTRSAVYPELRKYLPGSPLPSPTPSIELWPSLPRMSFSADLAQHSNIFIGREWLFERVRTWARSTKSRALLLTADAGVGKSALASQLLARLNVQGAHFCNRSNIESCRTDVWIAELSRQLADRFPAYRKAVDQEKEPDWENDDPDSIFRKLIVNPLFTEERLLRGDEPWVLVIDGLDEAFSADDPAREPELAALVARAARTIPGWLRIIATSRPNEAIVNAFRIDGVKSQHLDAEGEENLADVSSFVTHRLSGSSTEDRDRILAQLLPAAHGNFLFAKMVLDSLEENPDLPLHEVIADSTRSNLSGLYLAILDRRFPDAKAYRAQTRPLLNCLVAARRSLPRSLICQASGMPLEEADRNLTILSPFLTCAHDEVSLFHKSFRDWLTQKAASRRFAADPAAGHRQLAEAFLDAHHRGSQLAPYFFFHGTTHLKTSGMQEELATLLHDRELTIERVKRGGGRGLTSDLHYCFGNDYESWPAAVKESLEESRSIPVRLFLAETHDMAGRHAPAVAICEEMLEKMPKERAIENAVHVKLATYLDHLAQHERCLGILDELVPELERRGEEGSTYWWARYHRGITFRRLHRYASALDELQEMRQDSHKEHQKTGSLHQLAVLELLIGDHQQGDFRLAETRLRQCMQERGDSPYNHRRAYEHRRLGQLNAIRGHLEDAEAAFDHARRISERCGHRRYLAKIERDLRAFVQVPNELRSTVPVPESLDAIAREFDLETTDLTSSFLVLKNLGQGYLELYRQLEPRGSTGRIATYEQVHQDGLLHATVTVLLFDKDGKVAIQRRREKESHGKWDVSAAGHVEVAELTKVAAVRETYEELGVLLDSHLLQPLYPLWKLEKIGEPAIAKDEHNGPLSYFYRTDAKTNHEVISVFLAPWRKPHRDRQVEIRWMSIEGAGREAELNAEQYASSFKQLFGHPENRERLRRALPDLGL